MSPPSAPALLFLALSFYACEEAPPPQPPAPPAPIGDAAAFYQQVEKVCSSGDAAAAAKLFDLRAIVSRIVGNKLTGRSLTRFQDGLVDGGSRPQGIFAVLAQLGLNGGTLKMLRARTVKGRTMVLVRGAGASGVNYFDFDVTKDPKTGALLADDVYIFLSGETLGVTLRRAVLPFLKGRPKGWARLVLSEDLQVKHMADIKKIVGLSSAGKVADGLRLFDELPAELRNRKHMLFIRLSLVNQTEDAAEYEKTLSLFRKHYPEDACIDMMAIDWHTLREDYPAALASLERVAKAVGGDPYLDLVAGGIHLLAGNSEAARKSMTQALEDEPELEDARFSLLDLSLKEDRFEEVIERIKDLEDRGHEYSLEEMQKTPEFEGFLASDEGKAWVAGRK